MTSRTQQQSYFNDFKSRITRKGFDWHWLIYGGVGVILAILGKYSVTEWGLLDGLSWGVVTFFLIYTGLIFLYFGKQSAATGVSWRPNGLSRFRSYLTFLPITHIIQQGEGTNRETADCRKSETDDNELSLRISIQKDLVIEAILSEYVAPWYTKISSNTAFLQKCRIILKSIFHQVGEKLRQVDRNEIAKEVIQTVHMHWKEYCDATSKSHNSNEDENIIKCFKFVHPYLQDEVEVSQRYEKMICHLLEDLVIPDLQSTLLCQFLAGILVKSFFLYYTDLLCSPCWINSNLIVLLSSDTILAELAGCSSQNSSAPPTPLPDRSPKNNVDDENDCFNPTPPPASTTPPTSDDHNIPGNTPPQKLDECLTGEEENRFLFGKPDLGQSSRPGSALPGKDCFSPLDRIKIQNDSPISSSSRASRGSPSPTASVSSALSGILPTTAFPLLPSSTYNALISPNPNNSAHPFLLFPPTKEDASVLSVDIGEIRCGNGVEKVGATFSVAMTDGGGAGDQLNSGNSTELRQNMGDSGQKDISSSDSTTNNNFVVKDEGNSFKATTPTHYFSFEEVSTRKSSHPMLDAAALSVDGALENQKKAVETPNKGSNIHELKIIGSEFDPKNAGRSPVYEEPEDFATSIAKLRSLLEQKESKKNLHGSTSSGIDTQNGGCDTGSTPVHGANKSRSSCAEPEFSPEGGGGGHEATNFQRDDHPTKPSHDLHDTCNQAPPHDHDHDDDENVPELKCYFLNITIPKVESYNDSGGQFDFYCIQYEGVYFDEKYDDHPRRVILRTTTIKRRFKEFLLLQSKLEEKSQWKPHLKGIKAPNRWLNLSFSKADAANTRKTNLERYLNQICSHPVLGTSREVLQFMAYGDEGFSLDPIQDISNDPKHLLSNKLEKLAKKFTGVINSLKDALPSFESNPPSPHSEGEDHPTQNVNISSAFEYTEEGGLEAAGANEHLMENTLDTTWLEKLVPSIEGGSDEMVANNDECSQQFSNVTLQISDVSPDATGEDDLESCTTYPLAASLTQLLCDVLWLRNCRPNNASVSTFMSLSGKSLENYVHETIDVFLSDEAVLGYLEWFGKSLKAETESAADLQQYDLCTELDLKNCLRKRIPAWVRWMWGRNRLDLTIERITGFFQFPIINQDLVLSLSELLFSKISPTQ